ncbi:MAG: VWA domain-containing protein [Gammaproteobacteria bacterium]
MYLKQGKKLTLSALWIFFSVVPSAWSVEPPEPQATSDIRILIDVSGSMKWNDPENLRRPALRMLTSLLPTGTSAGVWTFGKFVNMLVPYDRVDKSWKTNAKNAASEIHSKGLFTHIEEALDKSTWNWKEPDKTQQRSVILLTDGLVDISKNSRLNDQSRERIISSILPRLKKAGVTIHTIALSGEADEVLLKQLAATTDGWHEKAKTADGLERIFLRMFEKAANPDMLPLVENKVLVDDSIKELTLLIFRSTDDEPLIVTRPDGSTFSEDSISENVNWHHEERYNLITIDSPIVGEWKVNAKSDPDNRVMVITNLRTITTDLPNNISLGDKYTFLVTLTQRDGIIKEKDFLHFIQVKLTQKQQGGEIWAWTLLDNGRRADEERDDGTYSIILDDTLVEGRHELIVDIDGTTFQRTHRQTINVYDSPVITGISEYYNEHEDAVFERIVVTPRSGMIDPDSMQIEADITDANGESSHHPVTRASETEWQLDLNEYSHDTRHKIMLNISGERSSGKPVTKRTGPLYFGGSEEDNEIFAEEIASLKEHDATDIPENGEHVIDEAELTSESEQEDIPADNENPDEGSDPNWLIVASQVIIFNGLLIAGLWFTYKNREKVLSRLKSNFNPWSETSHE